MCILTAGEAKSIIRDSGDGLRAWHKLWQTYKRRTLARSLRKYKEAIMPKTATNPGEIISRINEWESKVKELQKEEGVTLDPMIMLATLTEITTPDIRDMIYQQGDGLFKDKDPTAMKAAFDDIREKIISWTSNRIASSSVDMHIGNLQQWELRANPWDAHPWEEPCQPCHSVETEYCSDYEINMMGSCFTCGVVGHPARLCPKAKARERHKEQKGTTVEKVPKERATSGMEKAEKDTLQKVG